MALSDLEINLLDKIYKAMTAVGTAATDPAQAKDVRIELRRLYRQLDAIRGMIINKQIETYVTKMEEKSAEFDKIAQGIKKDIAKIEKLTETIGEAADAIKFIINTAKGAMSIGLL
jgi:hypothetical protein